MGQYSVQVNQVQLDKAIRVFSGMPDMQRKIHQQAMNKAATGVRTDMARAAQQEVTAAYGKMLASISIKKATSADPSAYVRSEGKVMPLSYYKVSQMKTGIKVQVLKSSTPTVIKHAFLATMKGGHKGAFWRKYKDKRKPVNKKMNYGALPIKFRLPIEQLFGPSIPDILKRKMAIDTVMRQADARLQVEYERVLNNEMRKL